MVESFRQLYFTESIAEALNLLSFPIWIFDLESMTIAWANPAALKLWNAPNLLSLQQRNWQDYSEASYILLRQYLEALQEGKTITEKLTFYPQGEAVLVKCLCYGISLPPGRLAMLVEGIIEQERAADRKIVIKAQNHVLISLHDPQGKILMQNPVAVKTYGQRKLLNRFLDLNLISKVLTPEQKHKVFREKAKMITNHGVRWHLVEIHQPKDPMTGEKLILVKETDLAEPKAREEFYRLLTEQAADLISRHRCDGIYLYTSPACYTLFGYMPIDLIGRSIEEFTHPEDYQRIKEFYTKVLQDEKVERITYQMRCQNGKYIWVETTGKVVKNDKNKQHSEIICVSRDVTKRQQTQQLLANQKEILEKIAIGAPLSETLTLLIKSLETQSQGMIGSIMMLEKDGRHLRLLAGPNLPAGYLTDVDGVEIFPDKGACGRAIHSKEMVVSDDILLDPCWQDYQDWISRYGLRACWSMPIFFDQQEVLGTFVAYFTQPRSPSQEERDLMATASYLAGIAIKHDQVQQTLKTAEAKYRDIFENISQGIYQTSLDGRYLSANPALAKIYGYDSPQDLINNLTDIKQQLYVAPQRRSELMQLLATQAIVDNFESEVYCRDGNTIWISENTRSVYDSEGNFLYFEGTVEDITNRRLVEKQLLHNAYYDVLTNLPNRFWFMEKLVNNIELAVNITNYSYAVLFIDLDDFKLVNDSLGHLVGDELLKKVAQRLQASLNNQAEIARFGGDEFAVLIPNLEDINQAISIAQNILNALKLPFDINQQEFFTGASIGITFSKLGYQKPEDILRDADLAMYKAKGQGKGCSVVFQPEMQISAQDNWQLINDLRRGIERQEFCLFYQPIIDLKTLKILGFEALLRWQHPERGLVSPNQFIALAEEMGLISNLGFLAFDSACHQLKIWQRLLPQYSDLMLNINVSVQQFKQEDFLSKIKSILTQSRVKSSNINLEITESCFLETSLSQAQLIKQIKNLGISFCIDDFGTGYSSLGRLHEFPISTLKIDRCFVQSLLTQSRQAAIVQTIINLGENLGMNVVAEGIESQSQLEKLQQLGCEYGQGYLFSPPVPSPLATELLQRGGF